jgi:hypothetical protein
MKTTQYSCPIDLKLAIAMNFSASFARMSAHPLTKWSQMVSEDKAKRALAELIEPVGNRFDSPGV